MPMPNGTAAALAAPERTRFFYGLLLDADRFQRETEYGNRKRWWINRLVLGSGVVQGLAVAVDNTASRGRIAPGMALDGFGRELVVPRALPFRPRQPTDDEGEPAGAALQHGVVDVFLAYAEEGADKVPVLVPECGEGDCAVSTIRESVRVLVRPTQLHPLPPACRVPGGFPLPPDARLHDALADRATTTSPAPPAAAEVFVARIDLDNVTVDTVGIPLVASNDTLYELIGCLAERVQQGLAGRVLHYVAGDGQAGNFGQPLPIPLEVELLDGGGNPVPNAVVVFTPDPLAASAGAANPPQALTGPNGRARTTWTLGNDLQQRLTASAVGSAISVTFQATAT